VLAGAHPIALVSFALLLGLFEGPAEIACAAALVFTVLDRKIEPRQLGVIELGIAVWLLAGLPGTLDAQSAITSEAATRPILALAFLVGRFAIATASEGVLRRMAIAFSAALVLNATYGFLQVLWFDPPLEALLAGRQRSQHLVDPAAPERLLMASGLFYSRLKLAHLGAVALGLIGIGALATPAPRRWWWIAGGVILGGGLYLTFRRAAPAAVCFGALALGAVLGRARWALGAGGAGAGALLLLLFTGAGRERVGEAALALHERAEIYRAALALWADHPWLGVGHGDYQAAIAGYAAELPEVLHTSAHNLWLQILAETGSVGLAGFMLAVGAALFRAGRAVRAGRERADARALLDRFSFLGLSTILALGVVHAVLYHRSVALCFWALLGVAAASGQPPPSNSSSSSKTVAS
jgi:O-antigen ligase